jgi:hypothetical protein
MHRLGLAVIGLSACTPAPAPARGAAPAPAPVIVSAPPAPAEPPEPEAEPAPSLPEIVEPTPAACRLSADDWSLRDLRLSVGGGRFAWAVHAAGSIVLPVTREPREVVAVFGRGTIRLVARADEVPLYTKAPRALLGIVTPDADAALGLRAAAPDSVQVEFGASVVLVRPDPVTDTLRCSELGIVPAKFDARASITKRKNLPKRWAAHEGVAIAATRGGSEVAAFGDAIEVGVLETRGGLARVLAEGPDFVVSGWVATRDLTNTRYVGAGYGRGVGELGAFQAAYTQLPSCVHALTLIGELGDERAIIGKIPMGSSYQLVDAPEDEDPRARKDPNRLVQVELPFSVWLRLEKNARLLVPAAELETCRPEPTGPIDPRPIPK